MKFILNSDATSIPEDGEPVRGDFVGKYTTPKELKEYMVLCPEENKPLTLYHLIRSKGLKRVICFVQSKVEVHRLTRVLCRLSELDSNNLPLRVNEISSDVSQKVHSSYINQFTTGKIDVYVLFWFFILQITYYFTFLD